MRNMSFSATTQQMRARTKTETRRLGWTNLKPGERVCAIVKGQGLKKGEKVQRIGVIECVGNRQERVDAITKAGCLREGFPDCSPRDFVDMFCQLNKCEPDRIINVIRFRFVEE